MNSFLQMKNYLIFFSRLIVIYYFNFFIPPLPEGRGGYTVLPLSVLPSVCPSVRLSFRPSKIFFVAFFSVTVDGRNLIFGHKLHIGTPYRGMRFWTHQIPTSCLPFLLIFIHIEHISSSDNKSVSHWIMFDYFFHV